MRLALACLAVVFAATALAMPASAHAEAEAPLLRDDVVAAGHEPAVVEPHTQWTGFLELSSSTNVTAAFYQVCRVGQSCFAPPTPAEKVGPRFRFDTSEYLANGRPVDYEAGWRLGVTWLLEERLENGTTRSVRFPIGPDMLSAGCQGDAALACSEAHYLAFDVAEDERGAPAVGAGLAFVALLAAVAVAAVRRR